MHSWKRTIITLVDMPILMANLKDIGIFAKFRLNSGEQKIAFWGKMS